MVTLVEQLGKHAIMWEDSVQANRELDKKQRAVVQTWKGWEHG
jgi:hypothetical protein